MRVTETRRFCIIFTIFLCIIMTNGCRHNSENDLVDNTVVIEENKKEEVPTASPTPFVKREALVFEAESQPLSGNLTTGSTRGGYSGKGYVDGFKDDTDTLTFSVNIEYPDFYDLDFTTAADSHKTNYVLLDGTAIGEIDSDTADFSVSTVTRVYLEAGPHDISVRKSWGWFNLDKLSIIQSDPLPDDLYTVEAKLSNPDASESTKRLMSYLIDIYGSQILTGQYCDLGMIGTECTAVNKETGSYPAVLGLDFMNYSPANVAHGASAHATDFALNYAANGGIVTFCWHWTMPDRYVKGNWYSSFYTDSCSFRLDEALNGSDPEGYNALLEGIDAIAQQLLILRDNDVPVLWRPLHEASGGWFWWGAAGAEAYKQLYILMYDKLTNEYGCNNLIWIWNAQGSEWYPGDEYVDIIGVDIYPGEQVYSSQINKFMEYAGIPGERKIVVMSENGCLFDPELAVRDGAMWGFFATWGGEFVLKSSAYANYSERYTDKEMLKKVYSSDYMITRGELPDLKTYPIREDFK